MSAMERDDDGAGPEDRTLRCSICSLDWPFERQFKVCPSCDEDTTPFSHMIPMPADEAQRLKAQFDFEKFYEEWDAEKDPARLLPSAEPS